MELARIDIASRPSRAPLAIALAAGLTVLAHADAATQCPDFSAPLVFPTGGDARTLAIADFNQDGATDVAVGNAGSSSLGILLGHGNGNFEPHVEHPTSTSPRDIATADFDGDGAPDLVSIQSPDAVAIRLGNGDGTFALAASYPTGGDDVAVGDLNGDGNVDLLIPRNYGFTVWLGLGDGTFTSRIDRSLGLAVAHGALGDLDGDGDLDLLLSGTYSMHQGFLTTLVGNGDGTFGSPNTYVTAMAPGRPALGDLNGDGRLDVVLPAHLVVSSYLGQGNGALAFSSSLFLAHSMLSAALGDFDADGSLDAAVGGQDLLAVVRGLGNGSFQPILSRAVGYAEAIAVADIDRDGASDLVWANPGSASGVGAMLGRGGGGFFAGDQYADPLLGPLTSVRAADVDLDGDLDLTSTRRDGGLYGLLALGDGTFGPLQQWVAGGATTSAHAIGDVDADGRPDVAICTDAHPSSQVTVALGQAGPSPFAAGTDYPLVNSPNHVAIGDLNLDGRPDLAITATDGNLQSPHTLQILLGNGDGTFVPGVAFRAGKSPYDVVIADMNGDTKPDLVVPDADSARFSVFLGQGDGTFPTRTRTLTQTAPIALAVADLDANGVLDVVVANVNSPYVTIHRGLGNGTFAGTMFGPTMAGPRDVAIGDLNGDGVLDLAITCVPGIQLLEGRGDGTFANRHHAIGISELDEALLADLDGDGELDVAALPSYLSAVAVYRRIPCTAVGVPDPVAALATRLALRTFPNPARSALTIQLVAPRSLTVDAEVFDPGGRSVRTIASGMALAAGTHRLVWDGTSHSGARMPHGVYFVRIRGGGDVAVRRVVLMD